jgi:glucosamine-phosphate N-acetyltransferase
MSSDCPLFSASLISPTINASLRKGLIFRPLQRSDFKYGHLDVLRELAHVGDITEEQWTERFDDMKKCNGSYFIVVIVDQNNEPAKTVIGTGTLIVEKKL